MKNRSPIYITLTAVFAALYAVAVVFLAPISFQIFQVRLADALLPLAILFGWPAVLGLALGAFVANFFGGLGPIDIIGGAIANLIAT
ncbi:MAG TPA: QueT transporter family protein, partial [Candidatus Acidoferrales bacterium]|nr:QueT transporter family protein [Candidatus Acidoferrales bacterium]